MPTPLHIKWYETRENLDGLSSVSYSKTTDTITTIGVGGITVAWDNWSQNWRIKWEKTEKRFEYHFEMKGQAPLDNPLKVRVPVLKFTDKWFRTHGHEFNLAHLLNNRVSQLLRFVGEKGYLVPGGTLFIVTREGIKESLADNKSWSLVMGYSAVEPKPEFPCNTMYCHIPELRIPKGLEVVKLAGAPRLTRYERPWVI